MIEQRTRFKRVEYNLLELVNGIDREEIALPDIQRPFVWSDNQVCELLNSMYLGYPVGTLLFWAEGSVGGSRKIGAGDKSDRPLLLVVDGQQRLTSLYSVMLGKTVRDKNYELKLIKISFNPVAGKFAVFKSSYSKDPEWIENITTVLKPGTKFVRFVNQFTSRLKAIRNISEEEELQIEENLDNLYNLPKYPFNSLSISSEVNLDEITDIFRLINTTGVKLGQGDFALSLLSVNWEKGRQELDKFCKEARSPSSISSQLVDPMPDRLLRVSIAHKFYEGQLKVIKDILDPNKNSPLLKSSKDKSDNGLTLLQSAQSETLNKLHWDQFINVVHDAGYRLRSMVSSSNVYYYAYAFYLIGRVKFNLTITKLTNPIARWFFSMCLTSRYSTASETTVRADLKKVADVSSGDEFIRILDSEFLRELTPDYWSIKLPNQLDVNYSKSQPAINAYLAAQMLLDAPLLFSNKKISTVLCSAPSAGKKPTDWHHLFPKAWLSSMNIDPKIENKFANYALIEWPDNISINKSPPSEYVKKYKDSMSADKWEDMHKFHALPIRWEKMQYVEFLEKRQSLMANLIHDGFETLKS